MMAIDRAILEDALQITAAAVENIAAGLALPRIRPDEACAVPAAP